MQELESKGNFPIFLNKFGLKGKSEYLTLTREEKIITLKEYVKRLQSKKH